MILAMRRLIWVILISIFLAACEAAIPAPPPVTVVVSPVDYQSALADGVALALTATADRPAPATETQLARLGISLTPSLTPSYTPTPLPPTPTPQVTPSRPPPPSITPSPTFVPLALNVMDSSARSGVAGRLRVLNAWADASVDVYLNDVRISRSLPFAGATTYHQLETEAVRVTIVAANLTVGQVVAVPAGGSVSVLVVDFGAGVTLRPIYEDVSTPPTGASRLTVVQANPVLRRTDLLLPEVQRSLALDLAVSQHAGPIDLPSRNYRVEFYDSAAPELLLTTLNNLQLDSQVNYLLVLLPPLESRSTLTDYVLFEGSAPRVNGDVGVQFVNAASQPLSVQWGGQTQLALLDVGNLSVPLPLPPSGTKLTLTDDRQRVIAEKDILPGDGDQLVVIHTNETDSTVEIAAFAQSAPSSRLNSHLRLINALPDITALSLELKVAGAPPATPVATPAQEWMVFLDSIPYGDSSSYAGLGSELYDVRVTLAGTETIIAALPEVQLLAGSIYDFVVIPGNESGSARLLLVQPDVQTGLALGQLDPLVVEQVQATLTAMAPSVVSVSSDTPTPTPTITPVYTNTPHPTNTPSVRPPSLLIDPVPPQVAVGTFVLLGLDFVPREDFVVSLVPSDRVLLRGVTDVNGTLLADIILPANMSDGLYIVRVCVGCTSGGPQQEAFTVINAIFPTPSPAPRFTPTPVPPTPDPSLLLTPTLPPAGPQPPADEPDDDDAGGQPPPPPPPPSPTEPPPPTPTEPPPPPPPPPPPTEPPPPPPTEPPPPPPPTDPPPPPPTDPPPPPPTEPPPPPDDPPPPPPDEPPPPPPPDDPPPDPGG
jgi:hypothetical protein